VGTVLVRFPDGSRDFRFSEKTLKVGDVVWHDGARYRIVDISADERDETVVIVEADSDDLGDLIESKKGGIELLPLEQA
jgi:hypothetical protein